MESKALSCKGFNPKEVLKTAALNEEAEAKIRALHDVETIRVLRTCIEDARYLTDNKEASLKIALALFDKGCDKVDTWVRKQRAFEDDVRKKEVHPPENSPSLKSWAGLRMKA